MEPSPLRRLILNEALPHGLCAVRGESPTIWVLDYRGSGQGQSWAIRIRGQGGNVGYADNQWFRLVRLSANNPDDPYDIRWWEIRVGWRHRWELPYDQGWSNQTACTAIESVNAEQVGDWLAESLAASERPISPQMDPVQQVHPVFRQLLGIDRQSEDEPSRPDPDI